MQNTARGVSIWNFASLFQIGNLKKVFKLEIMACKGAQCKPGIHRQLLHLQPFMDFNFEISGGRRKPQLDPTVTSEDLCSAFCAAVKLPPPD